jgi:glutathione reductase (NADPH)
VFLDIARLPRRIAFIGGGYIAFEFAHIAVRAGAHVTIIHRGERPLEGFDADLVDRLCSFTRSLGVDIRVGAEVTALERAAGAVHVWVETNGPASRIEVDAVFHSAGRRPNLGDLRLDRGNVAFDRSGVVVNEWLQSTSNPSVWAAGDSAGTAMPRLTPVSAMHGVTVSHNLLQAERRRVDSRPVPTVVFTIPPLASVGLSEEQVSRRTRRENASAFVDTSEWYTSRRVGEICSGAKVLVDSESDQIVGAHLLGRGADEVINVFALAMRQGIPASELRQTPFSYPTKTSDIEYLV